MNMSDSNAVKAIHAIDDARRDEVLALFQSAWWTADRSPAAVDRMIAGSDIVVGLLDSRSNRLVGFARAITDGVFLAVVLDVIVSPELRGKGHGARLVHELLARPEVAGVESIELVCQPELIGFYRRLGFTDRVGQSLLMRRSNNPLLVAALLGDAAPSAGHGSAPSTAAGHRPTT
jgi:ribosomal protein S18 acetylase RimI-like enzyme